MRLPLAVQLESRDGTLDQDARVKNAIVETKGEKLFLRKRPGLSRVGLIRAGVAQALTYWDSSVIAVIDDHVNIGAVGTSPTWNSGDKGAGITLSGGSLVATVATSSDDCVRANVSKSTGKWYWEVTVTTLTGVNLAVGVANGSQVLTAGLGQSSNSTAAIRSNGNILFNGNIVNGASFTPAQGDVIGLALNMDDRELGFYLNGTLIDTIVTAELPTGDLYPAVGGNGNVDATVLTANFGAASFTHSAPSGYSAINTDFQSWVSTSSTDLTPTTADLAFSTQDSGSNAFESKLMIKNREQAWVVDSDNDIAQITDADYPGKYTVTLTSLTRSGTTATATTAKDTNFQVGSTVTIAGADQADYNGSQTITGVTASATVPSSTGNIPIKITRSGTTATATSQFEPHGFATGDSVTITGADQSEYNGDFTVTYVSATQFTFTVTVTGGDITSPAGGTPVLNIKIRGQAWNYAGSWLSPSPLIGGDYNNFRFSTAFGEPHGLANGASVNIPTYGNVTISNVTASTFDFTVTGYTAQSQDTTGCTVVTPATISSITWANGIATVTTSSAHGLHTYRSHLIWITGATPSSYNTGDMFTVTSSTTFIYRINSGSPATPATGTITAKATDTVVGASFTFTVANSPVTPATGTITAQGGRNTVPGICYLDGYFCVADVNGVVYNSAEDDPSDWHALEYFTALAESGAAKAIAKNLSYGVLFKEWSTEFFHNAGNPPPGSPLSPVDNAHTLVGCASGESVADVSGTLLWIAQEKKQTGRSVYMMAANQQAKVSTPDVERVLNRDSLATVHAYGVKLDGHRLYVLTLGNTGVTLVYDLDSQLWGQWSSYTIASTVSVSSITRSGTTATVTATSHGLSDGDPVKISGADQSEYNGLFLAFKVDANTFTIQVDSGATTPATGTILAAPYTESYFKFTKYATASGDDLVLHESDGYVYELSPTKYLDYESPIDVHTRSIRVDGGSTVNKKMARIGVVGDSSTSFCVIRWSDDDCTTFSAYRKVALSDAEPEIRRCGAFKRRTIEMRHIADTALHLEGLEI